jgi:proteasome accessory factor A
VLLYQHAMDRLIADAAKGVGPKLRDLGWHGELRILKNCRDPDGEVYGVQENLEVEFARGLRLLVWRVGWAALFPLVVAWTAGIFAIAIALVLCALPLAPFAWFGWRHLNTRYDQRPNLWWFRFKEGRGPRVGRVVDLTLNFVPAQLITSLLWLCAFRPLRRCATGFLVSRCLITGAGTLERDGDVFTLSEKGTVTTRVCRATILPVDRAVFDTGNLLSSSFSVAQLKLGPMLGLFARRQRMQLGLADANLCHVAEYLKIGLTALVVDAAEAGALRRVPRPTRPVKALHAWRRDPRAKARVATGWFGREEMDAFEVQRAYLEAVEGFVREHPAPALEAQELLRLWRETLDLLDEDEGALVGRLDWVTKKYLLQKIGAGKPWVVRKKIDLRYHELDSGYWAELNAAGVVQRLTTEEEILRAIEEPPEDSPAKVRARFVKDLRWSGEKVQMSWSEVKVGRGSGAKIYRFEDLRGRDPES